MNNVALVLFVVPLVLVAVAGINFLVAWGILASLKGLGVIAAYTWGKVWAGAGLVTIIQLFFRNNN